MDGESTRRYTASQGANPTRLVQGVGHGNRMTLLQYTDRLLDIPPVIATPAHLQDLASDRDSWSQLIRVRSF